MNTITSAVNQMESRAKQLDSEMASILVEEQVQIPEQLGIHSEAYELYMNLWRSRQQIYQYLTRIESICDSFKKFEFVELS